MKVLTCFSTWICFLLTFIIVCYVQGGDPPRPTFPDVFQVEVQGIFLDQNAEVDGILYYDRTNNRAAVTYTYQGEKITLIQHLDDNEQVSVQGLDCEVTDLPENRDENFFPFTIKNNKKVLAPPEELFYFKDSVFEAQEMAIIPSLIYHVTMPIPQYRQDDCDVTHVFSKPETQLPDCEGHNCRSTLMTINVRCRDADKQVAVEHTYNFFRFRSAIQDPRVFQVPVGTYCDVKRTRVFPALPEYFTFGYDRDDQQQDSTGIYSAHKKIWFDSKLKLVRIDEYDDDGFLLSSRIFDFYGGEAYTIIARIPTCMSGPITGEMSLDQMSDLPRIIFKSEPTLEEAVYVGQRNVHNMNFQVWNTLSVDAETDARIVQEFYFSNMIPMNSSETLQLSHVEAYTYERKEEDNEAYKLSLQSVLHFFNFRTKPKEWKSFDVSLCYDHDQKLPLRLKIDGPPVYKGSKPYEELLERLQMRLIIVTNISVIRINELEGVIDGDGLITEFSGWILNKSKDLDSKTRQHEPNMEVALEMIEKASSEGKLNLKYTIEEQIFKYVIKTLKDEQSSTTESPSPSSTTEMPKNTSSDCYSGGSLAAASICLLLLGIVVGASGYYVFLKKRKSRNGDGLQMGKI